MHKTAVWKLGTKSSGKARFLRVDQALVGEVSLDDVTRIRDLIDHGKTVAEQG